MPSTSPSGAFNPRVSFSETSDATQLVQKVVCEEYAPNKLTGGVSVAWKRVEMRATPAQKTELPDAEATALLSEEVLGRIWNTPEEDQAWQHLQEGM